MPNLQVNADRDIARASTLPAPLYFTPEAFAEEKSKLFASTWQVVGLVHMTDNLPGGGEQLALFFRKGFGGEIKRRGQRGSASDVAISIDLKVRHSAPRASF